MNNTDNYLLKVKTLHGMILLGILSFACLDGLRDTFLRGNILSYLKEALPIFGLFVAITTTRPGCFKASKWYWVIFGLSLFLILCSFLTTFFYKGQFTHTISHLGAGGWSVYSKFVTLATLTLYLCIIRQLSPVWFNRIPSIYIYLCVVYSIATIVFVTTGWVNNLHQRNWHGRLSIGYPTMDSMVLFCGIIFSLTRKKILSVLFFHFLFGAVLIMQNTASGYILLLTYLISLIVFLPLRYKFLPLVILAFGAGILWYVYMYLASKFGTFGLLLIDKINGFVFGHETSSVSLRQQQIADLFQDVLSDPVAFIFGGGGQAGFYVESLFHATIGFTGILGILIHAIIITSIYLKSKLRTSGPPSMLLLFAYMIGGISLTAFYLYPFIFVIAYTFSLTHPISFSNYSSSSQNHSVVEPGT